MEDLGNLPPCAPPAGATFSCEARRWHQPATLDALRAVVGSLHAQGCAARLVAGGTGAGVYKDWVDEHDEEVVDVTRVAELRVASWDEVLTWLNVLYVKAYHSVLFPLLVHTQS